MTRLFIFPLLICVLWWLFLRYHGLTIKQGAKGFYAIFAFFGAFAAFLAITMHFLQ